MKRSRPFYVVSVDGHGLSKPTTTRAKAVRSRHWWTLRCPGLAADVVRLKGSRS